MWHAGSTSGGWAGSKLAICRVSTCAHGSWRARARALAPVAQITLLPGSGPEVSGEAADCASMDWRSSELDIAASSFGEPVVSPYHRRLVLLSGPPILLPLSSHLAALSRSFVHSLAPIHPSTQPPILPASSPFFSQSRTVLPRSPAAASPSLSHPPPPYSHPSIPPCCHRTLLPPCHPALRCPSSCRAPVALPFLQRRPPFALSASCSPLALVGL